ncbi:MAG: alpha/beta hydrolase [Chloroflexaceae bacterium]|jgi:haloacetate dehalogenase|nr:alpha/beta hydrolase [Chloroflexaceae bacterium]
MFENFTRTQIQTAPDVSINLVHGGSGPPVLLLHGYPQTHAIWHMVAPELARHFTVVAMDLRGYGDSSKPFGTPDHATYSKRAMAQDGIAVMQALGFNTFAVVGHDRGARVGHRMALDAPERVTRLAVLDIAPTLHVFQTIDQGMATAYYHWFFFIQPYDLPERLIGSDPLYYIRRKLGGWGTPLEKFAPAAMAEYERCFTPETIHASCEDYRAAASIDLEHDRADRHRRVDCPLLALWGAKGRIHHAYDVLAVWRDYASDVRGAALPCGHYLPEEVPAETTAALLEFLHDA